MTTAVDTRGTFTGRKMLLCMCAFFGVIIAVNLGLAFFALRTDTGLVVKNSYVASQDFNRNQAAARQQEALGWTLVPEIASDAITLQVHDAAGLPLLGLDLTGIVGRPVTDSHDQILRFVDAGGGLYQADIALGRGFWDLDVTATAVDGRTFRRIFRIEGGL